MVIVSPAIMFGAATGVAFLYWLEQRVLAWGLAAVLALGVLWTNALQYHDASLAPRDRMEELADLGERLDGQGPTLYSEFEEFGKHFLRKAAPEGSSEGWQRRYDLTTGRAGQPPHFGVANDIDQYTDRYLALLSHDRPAARLLRQPAALDLPPDPPRPLLRRLAAPRGGGATPEPPRRTGRRAPARREPRRARRARDRARCQAGGGRIAYAEMPQVGMFVPSQTAIPRGLVPRPLRRFRAPGARPRDDPGLDRRPARGPLRPVGRGEPAARLARARRRPRDGRRCARA